jgi:4-amino-4-deoxy-L-arabinose transferase-like glycosyltransferase
MSHVGYPLSPRIMWALLWVLLMGIAIWTRPFLPVDETRYLAVAWEMWRDGNFLVPHLNGETYSHKPPLLFWLMNLGWAVLGLNDWWPRLVAPLFGLGSLFLTESLARSLWPGREEIAAAGPTILLGCIFWTLFTTLTMFDMMLAFFTLVGLLGILRAWHGEKLFGFSILAVAIALGVLAKGPAILLHLLPVALLAPVWGDARKITLRSWYLGIFATTLIGASLSLAWAIPAAIAGGDAYAEAIFWGQSAGRMVKSFAHAQPWWWYLVVTPPLVLPWLIWPAVWKAVGGRAAWKRSDGLRPALENSGIKFCLSWFLPVFIAFSLISGKQLHYLLPIFPALALVLAYLLSERDRSYGTAASRQWVPVTLFMILSSTVLAAPMLGGMIRLPELLKALNTNWMILPLTFSIIMIAIPRRALGGKITVLTTLSCTMAIAVHLTVKPALETVYNLAPLAQKLAKLEAEGYPLAHNAKYHGQFHFMGRLNNPITAIGVNDARILEWAKRVPKGKIITYQGTIPSEAKPEIIYPFRRIFITVWDREQILAHPNIANRTQRKRNR